MAYDENMNLTRDHKEYDSKVKNLEGIFMKVQKVLSISKYKKELQQIQDDVDNDLSLSNKMMFSSMQMDYESFSFGDYNKRLDDLIKKVEEELLPFYELYLLSSKIDIQISEVNVENIGEIIQNTKMLIDSLNSLNNHNKDENNHLIDKAYRIIYSVIIHEEIFERSDILDYVNYLNVPSNMENIGRILSIDLRNLTGKDLVDEDLQAIIIDEDLRTIKTDGLGYDYLNSEFIRKISRKILGEKYLEYQRRKKQAISRLSLKVNALYNEKNGLLLDLNNNNDDMKKLYTNGSLLLTKVLSLILVPIITFSAGRMIGKSASNKITEYKTITRTVDLNTRNIIGEVEEVYDENETTYVATVLECSPWRQNPVGSGYIRNVTAYEYISNGMDGIHDVTIEEIDGSLLQKYTYIESKESLDKDDSTMNSTILITETYQNKNDNRKSTKYVIPFSIVGAGVGIAIDVALVLLGVYDFERIRRMFDDLNYEIKQYKLNNRLIVDRLNKMKEEAIKLQDEYNNVVKKYGTFEEQFIISEINSFSDIQDVKRRSRRKF